MNQLSQTTKHKYFLPVIFFFLIAIGFLFYSVNVVKNGGGTTTSHATRNTFLTPGDDALSLEKDLEALGQDPTVSDEQQLLNFR